MPELTTIEDRIYWIYANLCMAHAAVDAGRSSYGPGMYSIRSRMWRDFNKGTASPRSLVFDEKVKMRAVPACVYCGSTVNLSADHLLPTSKGGPDDGSNLVRACRSCNSSKSDHDLWAWYTLRDEFPPLLVVRRYFKYVFSWLGSEGLLSLPLDECSSKDLPFALEHWPTRFPAPDRLRLRVELQSQADLS